MAINKTLSNKLEKLTGDANKCSVCGRIMYKSDADELEYIKTKRGTEVFIHSECIKNWGK